MKKNCNKTDQLGMNPGTASHRLVKDLLYKFVIGAGHKCHRCGEKMLRENFSIEHIEPWMNSPDPRAMFFDLENIAYSHLKCNFAAARRPNAGTGRCGTDSMYTQGCRCRECKDAHCATVKRNNPPELRRERRRLKKMQDMLEGPKEN
ncbi:hypothetical protein M1M11_31720 [Pseudomonas azerbaijanoccidens]|uniref:hypothetical protein n=1 Tax=Pseudomonas TaxID=286 RepID=UPI00190B0829|nr:MULTISPECIES: hypothetical protein [Pseudomonas]MBK3437474.1 hypothetical protein [Pseudomonas sp. MF7448]MCK8669451.1 hypothetical protein [Pseudomonas azerbaijanoccidentalis]